MTAAPTNIPPADAPGSLPPPTGSALPAPDGAAPVPPKAGRSGSCGPKKSRRLLVLLALALVVAIGVGVFVVTRGGDDEELVAPNVTNVAGTAAIQALANAGFTTDPATASVSPCDAPVASQQTDGSTVTLTFAPCDRNIRFVPNVVGVRASALARISSRLPFPLEVVQSGTAQACDPPVAAQAPAPGTRTNGGSVLVVSIPAEPAECGIVSALPPEAGRTAAFFAPVPA